jgi:ketosteroid isomerase-like protein
MDLVERSYVAFDGLDSEEILPLYTEDVEWVLGEASLAFGTEAFHGHDGLRALVTALGSIFPDWAPAIEEVREREDGAMLVIFRAGGTAQRGEVELDVLGGQIIEFRDGLICRVTQTPAPPPGWDEATKAR